jgi:hypothetical protein
MENAVAELIFYLFFLSSKANIEALKTETDRIIINYNYMA